MKTNSPFKFEGISDKGSIDPEPVDRLQYCKINKYGGWTCEDALDKGKFLKRGPNPEEKIFANGKLLDDSKFIVVSDSKSRKSIPSSKLGDFIEESKEPTLSVVSVRPQAHHFSDIMRERGPVCHQLLPKNWQREIKPLSNPKGMELCSYCHQPLVGCSTYP